MNRVPASDVRVALNSSSLLDRKTPSPAPALAATALQSQVDSFTGIFLQETLKAQNLLALIGAGLAYRLTKAGTLSVGLFGNSFLTRAASVGFGLAGESAIFTGIHRGFNQLHHEPPRQSFGEEWIHSAVTFGTLKGFGFLGMGQNLLVRHALSDVGMVSGHQLAYGLGLQARPEGSLAEQLLRAEAFNWQMAAGLNLVHRLAPGLSAAERALDLSLPPVKMTGLWNGFLLPEPSRAALGPKVSAEELIVKSQSTEENAPSHPTAIGSVAPADSAVKTSSSFRMPGFKPILIAGDIHSSAIREAVKQQVPATCTYLLLHVMTRPRQDTNWLRDFFHSSSQLREIQILFSDGSHYRLSRGQDLAKRIGKTFEGFGEIPSQDSEVLRIRLLNSLEGWKAPKAAETPMEFPAYVRSLVRSTGRGTYLANLLREDSRVNLRELETRKADVANLVAGRPTESEPLPFTLLSSLASACRTDPRKLLVSSNRFHFSAWDARFWESESLPLYLAKEDLPVYEYFSGLKGKEKTAYFGGFARLVFEGRKNPFNYFTRGELAEALEISMDHVLALETGKEIPTEAQAQRLAQTLDVSLDRIVSSLKKALPPEELPPWALEFQSTGADSERLLEIPGGKRHFKKGLPPTAEEEKVRPASNLNRLKKERAKAKKAAAPRPEAPVPAAPPPPPPAPPVPGPVPAKAAPKPAAMATPPPPAPALVQPSRFQKAQVTPGPEGSVRIRYEGHEATTRWNPSENPVTSVKLGGKIRFVRKEDDGSYTIE